MATDLRGFNALDQNDINSIPDRVRQGMRFRALSDTYYLATMVLGYKKLTPDTHGPLCTFLDSCKTNRRLIQYPRSHFKTICVTVTHRIKEVLNLPERRILLVGDTAPNVRKHLGKIKNQFESNRLLRWLFPDRVWQDTAQAPTWNQDSLFLPQDSAGSIALHGEPTFDAIGAGGAVVSRHYDTINADDIIGEDEYLSDGEMSKKIDWFSNIEALFVPPLDNTQLDIPSTFWRTDDVYAYAEDFYGEGAEPIKTGPFSYLRGGIAVFRRGAVEDGKAIFPEVRDPETGKIVNGYPLGFFERLREKNPERYAAQYANNPRSAENAYFQMGYLRYYEVRSDEGSLISVDRGSGIVEIVDTRNLVRISFCDPHAGGTNRFRGSRAAVITTAVDPRYPRIYILDCWIKRAPTDKIVDEIFRQQGKWDPETFSIEANGLQKMLKYWIEERMERDPRGSPQINYYPFIPKGDKDGDRRIKGLQPLFKAGQIFLQRGFFEFIEEYSAWPRGTKDGLDCLSQGLELWDVDLQSTEEELYAYEQELQRGRSVATGY